MPNENRTTAWAALHRGDGTELTDVDAPGYSRVPYTQDGAKWPKAIADWGWIEFVSAWDAETGGKCVSAPKLQPIKGG